jgi:DNA repair protein RecO (recombination protein O)
MDERTVGLILRTRPLTETSLIVQWLTRDLGRISTVAKGARRSKSPFRGKLDLFYLADLSFRRSRSSELHALREVSVQKFHAALRGNLNYLQQAAYFVQLIEQTTETETPLPAIFELMTEALTALLLDPARPLTIFAFEMKLLNELGLRPGINQGGCSAGGREILAKCGSSDWPALTRLKLSVAQNHEISKFLSSFVGFHLGRVPVGRTAALTC